MTPSKQTLAIAALGLSLGIMTSMHASADSFGNGSNTFTIDFVNVGDPGNPDDSGSTGSYFLPYGGVSYEYRIGAQEVSRDMINKANAEGGLNITMQDMTTVGGNGDNRPATDISWNEAARFVNWLNTSNGFTEAYKFALQPGDVGYNSNANILLWEPGDEGYDPNNLFRNADAHYFLPSRDEWYKAAFYSGTGNIYYDYATQLDAPTTPTAVSSGTGAGEAVYNQLVTSGPADVNNAGGLSHYGTMGQGGNVFEITESAYAGANDVADEQRAAFDGNWFVNDLQLRSGYEGFTSPQLQNLNFQGFRVASVPEPSSTLLVLFAGGALLLRKRSRPSA